MLFYSGTIQQYIKSVQQRTEWSFKQQEVKKNPLLEDMEKARKDFKMSMITNLLRAGKRLTSEEKAFLRQHAPDLYHQAVTVEAERDSFKKALSGCRTKDAADRLYHSQTLRFAGEISYVAKCSAPTDAKQKAINFIEYRAAAIGEAYREFTSEAKYKKLPTEAELREKAARAAAIEKAARDAARAKALNEKMIEERKKAERRKEEKKREEKFLREKIFWEKMRIKSDSKRRSGSAK